MTDIRASKVAIVAITNEAAAAMAVSQITIVAVQLEPDPIKRLVPMDLPGYIFCGKAYYIER